MARSDAASWGSPAILLQKGRGGESCANACPLHQRSNFKKKKIKISSFSQVRGHFNVAAVASEDDLALLGADAHGAARGALRNDLGLAALDKAALDDHCGRNGLSAVRGGHGRRATPNRPRVSRCTATPSSAFIGSWNSATERGVSGAATEQQVRWECKTDGATRRQR